MKSLYATTLMALSISFILVSTASAQRPRGVIPCDVQMSTNCSGSTGMRACSLQRNVGSSGTAATTCALTMSNNANCSIGMAATFLQTFHAVQTGPNPSCQWSCTACPEVTLDTADGLPVELLEFDIENGDTEEKDEEDKAGKPD